jgi:hypothetical protein
VVREGVGQGGEMTQALYAHMNNKTIKKFLKNGNLDYDTILQKDQYCKK